MTAVRLAAVLGSLVFLAVLLSPVSPLGIPLENPSPNPSIIAEEPIDEAKIAPSEVSPEDFEECNSINDGIQSIVASGPGKNETYKIAADLLVGEYCNRPELVHEISAAADPGLNLVAYACEAASGTEGDSALQDSMADHTMIYCESARTSIGDGIDSLLTAVGDFRQDFLAELEAANTDGDMTKDIDSIKAELDIITYLVNGSRSLMDSDEYYDASQMLEKASESFGTLLEKVGSV
ncbi:MAG: hypothetical protein ACRD99_00460 [Nitrososphaera sp.]